jgi:hypothetical protein
MPPECFGWHILSQDIQCTLRDPSASPHQKLEEMEPSFLHWVLLNLKQRHMFLRVLVVLTHDLAVGSLMGALNQLNI